MSDALGGVGDQGIGDGPMGDGGYQILSLGLSDGAGFEQRS